jgi:threonine synthase
MWKAWDELEALGLIGSARPRMVSVQSAQTPPLVRAFDAGAPDTTPADAGETLCTGLNVPGGVGHFRVLEILRTSGGGAVAVEEADTAAALQAVWQRTHEWICPEGAACLAALERLVDTGTIRQGDRVVVVNTASLEKYLPSVRHLL